MRVLPFCLLAAVAALPSVAGSAQMTVTTQSELKLYDVTIRRFDPAREPASGTSFVLPVNSPDAEHAAASTLANAASFSRKTDGDRPLPVAFMVERIVQRR